MGAVRYFNFFMTGTVHGAAPRTLASVGQYNLKLARV